MVKPLKGKRLLILGATMDEWSLVKRAQELGAYVIVTDIFDENRSPSKKIADEAWYDSWTDVDQIVEKCKKHGIDGITAGYSEIKIDYLIQICEKLGLPCYANMEQLNVTRDKVRFKEACRACGIPTVKEYTTIDEVDEYPVIVKPVDRAGSIGVGIATDYNELVKAYDYALSMSLTRNVIIEKFMAGTKVDVYYAVEEGKPKIITTCDTIMSSKNGYERVIQNAWLYPHRHEKKLIERHDTSFKQLIAKMGIRYGCIFFSGFEDEHGDYVFFECGFRLEGGMQYEYTKRKGLFNFLDLFIVHALTGDTFLVEHGHKYNPALKLCTVNVFAKKGRISSIQGFEKLMEVPECTLSHVSSKVGDTCDDDKAILSMIGMFAFTEEDPNKLQELVEKAACGITVLDENGDDIIYDRVDSHLIAEWWD